MELNFSESQHNSSDIEEQEQDWTKWYSNLKLIEVYVLNETITLNLLPSAHGRPIPSENIQSEK